MNALLCAIGLHSYGEWIEFHWSWCWREKRCKHCPAIKTRYYE